MLGNEGMIRRVSPFYIDGNVVRLRNSALTGMLPTLEMATATNPVGNAAVSTAIIDAHSGSVITLTGAGNAQTLQDPTDTTAGKSFVVLADDGNGANTIQVNGVVMSAGEGQAFVWGGSAWVAITAVDADGITFTPAGGIVATNVQAAVEEVDTEKLAKASNLSDVAAAATAFDNIKQPATDAYTGVTERATTAEDVTGAATDKATTPAGLTARMAAPGEIGGTTPAKATFTELIANTASRILNNIWITGRNFAGSAWVNLFKLNESDEIEVGATLVTGTIEITSDSGAVTMIDFPVSATPVAGTEESYTFKIDGDNILKIRAEADSSGGIQNSSVVAERPINLKEITTPTAIASYGALYTKADNNLYFQDGAGVEHTVTIS